MITSGGVLWELTHVVQIASAVVIPVLAVSCEGNFGKYG
jgi:hypothetical protein